MSVEANASVSLTAALACVWLEGDGVVGDLGLKLRLASADVVEGLGPFEAIMLA